MQSRFSNCILWIDYCVLFTSLNLIVKKKLLQLTPGPSLIHQGTPVRVQGSSSRSSSTVDRTPWVTHDEDKDEMMRESLNNLFSRR